MPRAKMKMNQDTTVKNTASTAVRTIGTGGSDRLETNTAATTAAIKPTLLTKKANTAMDRLIMIKGRQGKRNSSLACISPWMIKKTAMATSTRDRKSTRLNSSHVATSYAVFCLKIKKR